jgi:Zn-dependent protease
MEERPHFSIFGIPIRVRWTFAITAYLAFQSGAAPQTGAAIVAIVFVSILLHELGHAFMGRAFGLHPSVQLYAFGGLTSWVGGRNITHGKSLLISLAGPAVSLSIGAIAFVPAAMHPDNEVLTAVLVVNGGWGLFNMLPLMPLDGGNALRSFLHFVKAPALAEVGTRVLGVLIAVPLVILSRGNMLMALFLGMFAVNNIQGLVLYLRQKKDNDLLEALRAKYPAWVTAKDGKSMIEAALKARAEAKTDYLRAYATEVLAMGQTIDGDPKSGLATIEQGMPPGMMPGLSVYLHILFEAGEHERAMSLASQMMSAGDDDLKQQAESVLASRQLSHA